MSYFARRGSFHLVILTEVYESGRSGEISSRRLGRCLCKRDLSVPLCSSRDDNIPPHIAAYAQWCAGGVLVDDYSSGGRCICAANRCGGVAKPAAPPLNSFLSSPIRVCRSFSSARLKQANPHWLLNIKFLIPVMHETPFKFWVLKYYKIHATIKQTNFRAACIARSCVTVAGNGNCTVWGDYDKSSNSGRW